MALKIPIYSTLSPKAKQYVHLVAGGIGMLAVALTTSSLIGVGPSHGTAPEDLPKPKRLGSVPGGALEPKDAWMGGAGKEVADLKARLREQETELARVSAEQKQIADGLRSQMSALQSGGNFGARQSAAAAPSAAAASDAASGAAPALPLFQPKAPSPPPAARVPAANLPQAFPSQRGVGYPPGSPNGSPPGPGFDSSGTAVPVAPPTLLRVSIASPAADRAPTSGASGATDPGAGPRRANGPVRRLGSFLPVGVTRAVLLGGLAAPTGGQAQSNPIPVLIRLVDLSELPNGFRAQTKGCLVVGEGYGDHMAERAYIRATLLSCTMHDGRVLEVPIKGSIFDESGMNGVTGKLVTKQGAILGNALLAGIASGIGSGIASATQSVSNTALGTVTSTPTDTASIMRMGLGTGVSKALDRMAQYYINLAEKTFPVIEVQAGRGVDLVLQQGVFLDVSLAALPSSISAAAPVRGSAPDTDRSDLMRAVDDGDDEDFPTGPRNLH
ncbi:MAG: TraB/VirB10 family protein [Rubrivivax sp.]